MIGLCASQKKGLNKPVIKEIGNLLIIPEKVGSISPMSYLLPPVSE
jgi:hypothetical protein